MKRFGRIMFCFLPALLAFGLQQLISIPAVGLALLGGFYTKGATSIDDCMDAFLNIISTANFNVCQCSLRYCCPCGICLLVL